jgi:hypothetical protein
LKLAGRLGQDALLGSSCQAARELLPPLNCALSIADGSKNHFKWARAVFAAGRFLADWKADDFMRIFYQANRRRRYAKTPLCLSALRASVAAGLIFWLAIGPAASGR